MFQDLIDDWFGLNQVISPVYLLPTVLIGWIVFRRRGGTSGFVSWLLPSAAWRHASTRVDIALFLLTRVMSFLGITAIFTAVPAVAVIVSDWVPGVMGPFVDISPLALGMLFWIVGDFAVFFSHMAHHRIQALWALHAVHHSAAVMTPITAYRQHPLAILMNASIQTVVQGIILGLLVGALAPGTTIVEIAGVNAFAVLSLLALQNFHHSHIWISFGPILEHVFISPAMHQIHHSDNPVHYDKNYGVSLAIWDWIFGTLYIPARDETVQFGLSGAAEAPLMQQRLGVILVDPLRRMIGRAR